MAWNPDSGTGCERRAWRPRPAPGPWISHFCPQAAAGGEQYRVGHSEKYFLCVSGARELSVFLNDHGPYSSLERHLTEAKQVPGRILGDLRVALSPGSCGK